MKVILLKTYFMLKFSKNRTQKMPKLPVAGVLGKAFRHFDKLTNQAQ
jgi:hypothetical protein